MMSSGMARDGMYMYSYSLGLLRVVMKYKLKNLRQKKVAPGVETTLSKRRFAVIRSAVGVYVLPS